MGIEHSRDRRDKKRRAKDILRAAAIAAGVFAGATDNQTAGSAQRDSDALQIERAQKNHPYPEFRRSQHIEDRRFNTEALAAANGADEEPQFSVVTDASDSALAKEAGIEEITPKSPADILRERLFNQGKEALKKEPLRKKVAKKRLRPDA